MEALQRLMNGSILMHDQWQHSNGCSMAAPHCMNNGSTPTPDQWQHFNTRSVATLQQMLNGSILIHYQ